MLSGYDLVNKILNHPNGGVEKLLAYAGNDESSWLELKASVQLLPEDEKRGEKPGDLYWNIAKAIISMMNTAGGAVIIGIQDKTHELVPLEQHDPRHIIETKGLEEYRRTEILEKIWPQNGKWKDKKNTNIEQLPLPNNLLEIKAAIYRGGNIAVILVKPSQNCLLVIHDDVEILFHRIIGDIGKVQELNRNSAINQYQQNRQVEYECFDALYAKFLDEIKKSSHEQIVEDAISAYYQKLSQKNQQLLTAFTPLDASEQEYNLDDEEVFSPNATEILYENDEKWLDDNDEASEDEDDETLEDTEENNEGKGEDEDGYEDGYEDEDKDGNEIDAINLLSKEDAAKSLRSGDLLSLLNELPRVAVISEPGGGKTTCLINYALQHYKNYDHDKLLAIYLPLGQWGKTCSLSDLLSKAVGLDLAQLEALIETGRVRLVLDAINECPEQFQTAAGQNIRFFLDSHPLLPCVISSRTPDNVASFGFPIFSVQPMTKEKARQYLCHYLKDEKLADDIQAQLSTLASGEALSSNPMLLRMIISVVNSSQDKKIPTGRAKLYRKWLEQWYRREENKAELAGRRLPWLYEEAMTHLSEIALQGRLQGYRDIPRDIALQVLDDMDDKNFEQFCQGPLLYVEDNFVKFRHETFQEYLCAEALLRKPDALDNTDDNYATWGMPLAYAFELNGFLPKTLFQKAWDMNPWFGLAISNEQFNNVTKLSTNPNDVYPEYQGEVISPNNTYQNNLIKLISSILFQEKDVNDFFLSKKTRMFFYFPKMLC